MAAPSDPLTPFFDMVGMAARGDPAMLRALAATLGSFSVRLLVAGLIFAATLWLARRLAGLAGAAVERIHQHHAADRTLPLFVSGVVKYVIIAVGLVAVLQQLGVQATSVIAVLGAASLAVGLALQGTLSNVAAGVMILLLRPFRIGARVQLNGRDGIITGMDLFNTKILDVEGMTLYAPNGKVFGDYIVNVSQAGRQRIELVVGVIYDNDLDLALEVMMALARADKRVMAEPAPWAKVTALGDIKVELTLRCWAAPDDAANVRADLLKQVKETFDDRGLGFPNPPPTPVPAEPPRRTVSRQAPN